jgi:hypothetical protein
MPELNIIQPQQVDWSVIKMADILFLQRPHDAKHLHIARMASIQNVPIWVDFDDWFFEIPHTNPALPIYGKQENIDVIKQVLSIANVVTVSTEALREYLLPYVTCEVITVLNAYDMDLLEDFVMPTQHKKRIVWRGGHTHAADLDVLKEAVIELSYKHTQFNWTFMAYAPWWTNLMRPGSYSTLAPIELMQYFDNAHQQKAVAWIFPLTDCNFNRAKSNIAWIEASYAGAKMFAQDLPEFNKPGCTTFKDGKDFIFKTKSVFEEGYDPREDIKLSQDYIRENLCLRDVNQTRKLIIKGLLRDV